MEEDKKWHCVHCMGTRFRTEEGLVSHNKSIHSKLKKTCVYCLNKFGRDAALQQHLSGNGCRKKGQRKEKKAEEEKEKKKTNNQKVQKKKKTKTKKKKKKKNKNKNHNKK